MSWDVFIQHLPASARTVSDIPDEYVGEALGKRDDVIARIGTRFPDLDFSDPEWGRLVRPDYAIDITMTGSDVITGLTLHVRGSDRAVDAVTDMIDALGARALDSWTGEIYDPKLALDSIRGWRAYSEDLG